MFFEKNEAVDNKKIIMGCLRPKKMDFANDFVANFDNYAEFCILHL